MLHPTLSAGNPATERPHVLLLAHPDNFVEVFGPMNLAVTICRVPWTGSVDTNNLALEWAELTMPPAAKQVYLPCNLLAADLLRPITPSDIAVAKANRELLATLRAIEEGGR